MQQRLDLDAFGPQHLKDGFVGRHRERAVGALEHDLERLVVRHRLGVACGALEQFEMHHADRPVPGRLAHRANRGRSARKHRHARLAGEPRAGTSGQCRPKGLHRQSES